MRIRLHRAWIVLDCHRPTSAEWMAKNRICRAEQGPYRIALNANTSGGPGGAWPREWTVECKMTVHQDNDGEPVPIESGDIKERDPI